MGDLRNISIVCSADPAQIRSRIQTINEFNPASARIAGNSLSPNENPGNTAQTGAQEQQDTKQGKLCSGAITVISGSDAEHLT